MNVDPHRQTDLTCGGKEKQILWMLPMERKVDYSSFFPSISWRKNAFLAKLLMATLSSSSSSSSRSGILGSTCDEPDNVSEACQGDDLCLRFSTQGIERILFYIHTQVATVKMDDFISWRKKPQPESKNRKIDFEILLDRSGVFSLPLFSICPRDQGGKISQLTETRLKIRLSYWPSSTFWLQGIKLAVQNCFDRQLFLVVWTLLLCNDRTSSVRFSVLFSLALTSESSVVLSKLLQLSILPAVWLLCPII